MQPPDVEMSPRQLNPSLEEAYQATASLAPNDRLRVIVRLWASLPADHWAAPTPGELAEVARKLSEVDSGERLEAPWEVVRDVVDLGAPLFHGPREHVYSASRRFDLAGIFALTVLYSLLLGAFRGVTHYMGFSPIWIAFAGIFVTIVGCAQAFLFGGTKPRPASVYAGAGAWLLCCVLYAVSIPRATFSPITSLFTAIFFGSPLGYLVGALVGGTFLMADVVRKRYRRFDDEPTEAESTPVEELEHPLGALPEQRDRHDLEPAG